MAASGKLDDVKRLLTADAKLIDSRDEKQVRQYLNEVSDAICSVHALVEMFRGMDVFLIFFRFFFLQRTPLHCAAEKGCFRVVEYLLTQGAHVDSKDKDEV